MTRALNGTAYSLTGRDSAPVVTLIHGIGLNRQLWRDYVPVLSRHFRVLSYDLYGHGESSRACESLSLTNLAVQLRELLDELDISCTSIVGFSLGGMINRRFAMDFPKRTRALVILNSPHERSPQAQQLVEERVIQTADGGPAATLDSSLQRWFTPEFLTTQTDTIDEIRGWILNNDPVTFTQSRQILASGVLELIRPRPPINHPSLVMTCENDSGSTPAMTNAIAAEITGAKALIIPRLQHLGLLEQPSLFVKPITDFLQHVIH